MKNKFITIILLLLIVLTLPFVFRNELFGFENTARAFGDLRIDFHTPAGQPLFTVNNMAPGDISSKTVDVTNGSSTAKRMSVKGIRKNGVGDSPKLETVLEIKIQSGTTILYGAGSVTGPKTVQDFFNDSAGTNGVQLNTVNAGQKKIYTFVVTFPQAAGNEFQNKSVVFDVTFGTVTTGNGNQTIVQTNNTTIINTVNARANTGGNRILHSTGSAIIRTGNAIANIFIRNIAGINFVRW